MKPENNASVPSAVNYLQQELGLISTGLRLVAERQRNRDPFRRSLMQSVKLVLASQAAVLTRERSLPLGAVGSHGAVPLRRWGRGPNRTPSRRFLPSHPRGCDVAAWWRGGVFFLLLEKGVGDIIT